MVMLEKHSRYFNSDADDYKNHSAIQYILIFFKRVNYKDINPLNTLNTVAGQQIIQYRQMILVRKFMYWIQRIMLK